MNMNCTFEKIFIKGIKRKNEEIEEFIDASIELKEKSLREID